MGLHELIKTGQELEQLADLLYKEIKRHRSTVSRYNSFISDSAEFMNGKVMDQGTGISSGIVKEMMERGTFTQTDVDDLTPQVFRRVKVTRDLRVHRFRFKTKGIELPREQESFIETIPDTLAMYDDELIGFTESHRDTIISRSLTVRQYVVVNSKGGVAIESVPFFEIDYSHSDEPVPVHRRITAVCNSDDDLRRLPAFIKYIPDPTPDKRIKSAGSFSEAFHELYKISGLEFISLKDAGIKKHALYDVVMLDGIPIHEIFGHHFEEPIGPIGFGRIGVFEYGQDLVYDANASMDKGITLVDNPLQEIEGLRVQGFSHFDAYGRKREPRVLIENARVAGFLGSEYADAKGLKRYLNLEKSTFVGNAVHSGFFPQPRMSCIVLDGPTQDIDLEGKIVITSITSGRTDTEDKTYALDCTEAYVIKDGEPRRVVPLTVSGGINQAIVNIQLLEDTTYVTGGCSSPDPIYPDVPSIAMISTFTKSQIWGAQQVYPVPISETQFKALSKKVKPRN